MPNSILTAAEYKNEIRSMSDRGLSEFIAQQLYEHCQNEESLAERVGALEGHDKKFAGAVGTAGGVFGGAIIAVLNWLSTKP